MEEVRNRDDLAKREVLRLARSLVAQRYCSRNQDCRWRALSCCPVGIANMLAKLAEQLHLVFNNLPNRELLLHPARVARTLPQLRAWNSLHNHPLDPELVCCTRRLR